MKHLFKKKQKEEGSKERRKGKKERERDKERRTTIKKYSLSFPEEEGILMTITLSKCPACWATIQILDCQAARHVTQFLKTTRERDRDRERESTHLIDLLSISIYLSICLSY